MRDEHPTERQIVVWLDTEESDRGSAWIADHLAGCSQCRTLADQAGRPIPVPQAGPFDAAASVQLPPPVQPQPARGQVWRVRWDDETAMALLWNVEVDSLQVIPVTPDVAFADDTTVILDVDETGRFGPVGVWVGLETPVPPYVLDICWGELPTGEIERVRRLFRAGKPIDLFDVQVGQRIAEPFDERLEYRALIGETFNRLAEAQWLLDEVGSQTLPDLAAAAGVDMSAVAQELGLPATERLLLRRQARPLRDDEADRLSHLLGVPADVVLATNPVIPASLVSVLGRPEWRSVITERSRRSRISESEERRRAAYAVLGMAARQTGTTDAEAQWYERLKHYFGS